MDEIIKGYVTKYALSGKIQHVDLELSGPHEAGGPMWGKPLTSWECFKEGTEWFRTKEEALAACETMRAKKIASLKKQIAKLEKRDFAKDLT